MQVKISSGRQSMQIMAEDDEYEYDKEADFREQMLNNNEIEGILPFDVRRDGEHKIYEYRVEGDTSLEQICENGKLTLEQVKNILLGILGVLYRSSEYLLLEDDFVVEATGVFFDKNNNIRIAYYPGYNKNILQQLNVLSDYLMNRLDYHDDSAVVIVYQFYMLTQEKNITLENLTKMIKEKMDEIEKNKDSQEIDVVGNLNDASEKNIPYGYERDNAELRELTNDKSVDSSKILSEKNDYKKIISVMSISQKTVSIIGFAAPIIIAGIAFYFGFYNLKNGNKDMLKIGLSIVLIACVWLFTYKKQIVPVIKKQNDVNKYSFEEKDEATVVLFNNNSEENKRGMQPVCSLVSDEFDTINVDKVPFFIGADAKYMDYVLDKRGVSRRHLKIDKINGALVVVDLSSTNGTFINGTAIKPQIPEIIRRGTKISIGPYSYYLN